MYEESKWNPKVLSWKTLIYLCAACFVVVVFHNVVSLNWVVQEEVSKSETVFRYSRLAPLIFFVISVTLALTAIFWVKNRGMRIFVGMFCVLFLFFSTAIYQAKVRVSHQLYLHRVGLPLFPRWHRVDVSKIDHIQIVTRKYYRMSRYNSVKIEEYLQVSLSDGSTVRLPYGSQVTNAAIDNLFRRLEARGVQIEEKYIDETR